VSKFDNYCCEFNFFNILISAFIVFKTQNSKIKSLIRRRKKSKTMSLRVIPKYRETKQSLWMNY